MDDMVRTKSTETARGGRIFVRRAGRLTSEETHDAAFPDGLPRKRTLAELKDGIRRYVRLRHPRRRPHDAW